MNGRTFIGLIDTVRFTKPPVLEVTSAGNMKVWTAYDKKLENGTYYTTNDLGQLLQVTERIDGTFDARIITKGLTE